MLEGIFRSRCLAMRSHTRAATPIAVSAEQRTREMPNTRGELPWLSLSASAAIPGTRVLHRRGQWYATIVAVALPYCWIVYDMDRDGGRGREKRLRLDDLTLYRWA